MEDYSYRYVGVGECPEAWRGLHKRGIQCWCKKSCAVCGNPKHSAIHMFCRGQGPSGPPYGHAYVPLRPISPQDGAASTPREG